MILINNIFKIYNLNFGFFVKMMLNQKKFLKLIINKIIIFNKQIKIIILYIIKEQKLLNIVL